MTPRDHVRACEHERTGEDGGQVWFHNDLAGAVPTAALPLCVPRQRGPQD